MAVAYWDWTGRADDTGDGLSWPTAKHTLAAASTVASAGAYPGDPAAQVKIAGQLVTNKGAATWTKDSQSVVFVADAALSAGDIIRPQGFPYAPPYEVTAYVAGTKTATLRSAFRLTTGSYSTDLLPVHALTTNQQSLSAANQLLTMHWNPATDTRPGITSYITAFTHGVTNGILINQSGTVVECGDGLPIHAIGDWIAGIAVTEAARFTGSLLLSRTSSGTHLYITASKLSLDVIVGIGGHYAIEDGGWTSLRIRHCEAHNNSYAVSCPSATPQIGRLVVRNSGIGAQVTYSWGWIGSYDIYDTSNAAGGVAMSYSPVLTHYWIGEWNVYSGNAVFPTGNVSVGGPVSLWRANDPYGVWTKTAGRGGSGYGLKCDPSDKLIASHLKLARPVAAGQAVVLKFWAVYTGTLADPPPCFVRLLEPNGLTVEDIAFTPNRSANTPGGSPDGWTDATQQTITFTGTTAQAGTIQFGIFCRDNAAGDAVLYVDDETTTPALTGGEDFGANEYHGLVPMAFAAAAGGGGLTLPKRYGLQGVA